MKIADILAEEAVVPALAGRTKAEVIDELAKVVATQHPELDHGRLVAALEERERLNSTALGDGVAIPHGRLAEVKRVIAAFGRHPTGVDFQSVDGKPTRLLFLLVAPAESSGAHLKALARISRLLKDEAFRARLLGSSDAHELYTIIRDEDARY